MTRRTYIEQIRRLIYNGQPSDDATITVGLVNSWLPAAIGTAARKNYVDNGQLDGISYVNGAFYTMFKNLTVTRDQYGLYKTELPQLPLGIGNDEGVSSMMLTDGVQNSYPVVWMNQNQRSFSRGMRPVQNKLIAYSEGKYVFFVSAMPLTGFTAQATMISGGDATDLNSTLNVPDDFFPIMTDYLISKLLLEKAQAVDAQNDGLDATVTT